MGRARSPGMASRRYCCWADRAAYTRRPLLLLLGRADSPPMDRALAARAVQSAWPGSRRRDQRWDRAAQRPAPPWGDCTQAAAH